MPGDIKIESQAQDRFYNTDLDEAAKGQGDHDACSDRLEDERLGDLYVGGSNAARLYRRCARRRDLDATDYEIVIGKHQILNQNSSNATNEPLKARASTLSRTDLIDFK